MGNDMGRDASAQRSAHMAAKTVGPETRCDRIGRAAREDVRSAVANRNEQHDRKQPRQQYGDLIDRARRDLWDGGGEDDQSSAAKASEMADREFERTIQSDPRTFGKDDSGEYSS